MLVVRYPNSADTAERSRSSDSTGIGTAQEPEKYNGPDFGMEKKNLFTRGRLWRFFISCLGNMF